MRKASSQRNKETNILCTYALFIILMLYSWFYRAPRGGFHFVFPPQSFFFFLLFFPLSVGECLLVDPEQASLEVVKVGDVFAHAFQVFARLDDDTSPQGPSRSRSIRPRTYSRDDVHRGFTGELLSVPEREEKTRGEGKGEINGKREKRKHETCVLTQVVRKRLKQNDI